MSVASPGALAHLVSTGFGGFYDGIAHLVATPTDVLTVLAIGLHAGLRGPAAARPALVLLGLAWLAGGALGVAALGAEGAESLRELDAAAALGLVVLGVLVASDSRVARAGVAALAAAAGLLHGLANGAAAPEPLVLVGAATAAATLATLTAAATVALPTGWPRIAARVAGSWIGAIGLLMLGWLFRPPSAGP